MVLIDPEKPIWSRLVAVISMLGVSGFILIWFTIPTFLVLLSIIFLPAPLLFAIAIFSPRVISERRLIYRFLSASVVISVIVCAFWICSILPGLHFNGRPVIPF